MYIFTAVNSGERCGPWASCFSELCCEVILPLFSARLITIKLYTILILSNAPRPLHFTNKLCVWGGGGGEGGMERGMLFTVNQPLPLINSSNVNSDEVTSLVCCNS